jgi:pyrroloquinoline quinone biosynthesis protein E
MTPNPLALIAEVTHRCPLHCVYCSNPLQLVAAKAELSTAEWIRVFREASHLGVLHLHLTGGEPAARADLKDLIAGGHQTGLYTNPGSAYQKLGCLGWWRRDSTIFN